MKSSYAGWVVAGVLLVLVCTLGAMQQQQPQVGRWQVVAGRYRRAEVDGAIPTYTVVDSVFRIDTATGKCDEMYFRSAVGAPTARGWSPIGEMPAGGW